MYTLLELKSKTFGQLKKIGDELNVLPEGDRRRRQSWIEAIAGVNPPLLQLLEVSPGPEVEQVQPIIETAETSATVEPAQDAPLESKFGRIVYPRPAQGAIKHAAETSPVAEVDRVQGTISQVVKTSPGVEVDPVQEQISQVAKTPPGVEIDRAEDFLPECSDCFGDGYMEDEFGRIKFCQQCEPKMSRQKTQSAIAPATKNLPGSRSKTSTAHQLLELFKSSAHIIEDSLGVKTEATVSESAIAPVVKNHIEEESDQNPSLTGIALSDRFCDRYSPPQAKIFHFQSDADGQLSLIDFEVLSEPEPPDPDDFESLDAFREAIARWDAKNPSCSDHCSDHCSDLLPSSQDNDVSPQDNDVSPQDKPLEVSLDSFCEWAPCPADWYEPATLLEPSKVMELSPVPKSSITSDFFIPTFGRWGDRPDRSDEPPDTGIFARLPKPKPSNFPPQVSQPKSAQVRLSQSGIPKLSRNYPETIPKPLDLSHNSNPFPRLVYDGRFPQGPSVINQRFHKGFNGISIKTAQFYDLNFTVFFQFVGTFIDT